MSQTNVKSIAKETLSSKKQPRSMYVKGQKAKSSLRGKSRPRSAHAHSSKTKDDSLLFDSSEESENEDNTFSETIDNRVEESLILQNTNKMTNVTVKLEKKNSHLKSQVDYYKDQNTKLESVILSLQDQSKEHDDELKAIKQQIEDKDVKISGLIAQNTKLVENIESEEKRGEKASIEMKILKEQLRDFETKDKINNYGIQVKLSESESKIRRFEDKERELNYRLTSYEREFEKYRHDHHQLEAKNADLQKKLYEMEIFSKKLEKDHVEKNNELYRLEAANKLYEDKIISLETKATHFETEYNQIKIKTDLENTNSENYQDTIKQLKGRIIQIETLLEKKNAELSNQNNQIEKFQKSISSYSEKQKQMMERLHSFEQVHRNSQNEIQGLKVKLEGLKSEYANEVFMKHEEQRTKETLQLKLQSNIKSVSNLNEQLRYSEEIRAQLKANLKRLVEAVPSLLQYADGLKDRYAAAKEANRALAESLDLYQENNHLPDTEICCHVGNLLTLTRANATCGNSFSWDLLSGYLGLKHPELHNKTKKKSEDIKPFRVIKKTTIHDHEPDEEIFELASFKGDRNGKIFLERSGINLFLKFSQKKASGKKLYNLFVTKIAELLHHQRKELMDRGQERSELEANHATLSEELSNYQQQVKKLKTYCESDHGPRQRLIHLIIQLLRENYLQNESKTFITETNSITMDVLPWKKIDLSSCNITDTDLQEIIFILQDTKMMNRLEELDLDNNRITDVGIHILVPMISSSISLKLIKCSENEISSDGFYSLVKAAEGNPRIRSTSIDKTTCTIKGFGNGNNNSFAVTTSQSMDKKKKYENHNNNNSIILQIIARIPSESMDEKMNLICSEKLVDVSVEKIMGNPKITKYLEMNSIELSDKDTEVQNPKKKTKIIKKKKSEPYLSVMSNSTTQKKKTMMKERKKLNSAPSIRQSKSQSNLRTETNTKPLSRLSLKSTIGKKQSSSTGNLHLLPKDTLNKSGTGTTHVDNIRKLKKNKVKRKK